MNYKVYIIFFIILILFILVQYHNYCIKNKLRHTIFEVLDYFNLFSRQSICLSSIVENS